MLAVFSEELSSWGGLCCITAAESLSDRLALDATTPSGPVSPPICPETQSSQTPASIPVVTQTVTLQPETQPAYLLPVLTSFFFGKRRHRSRPAKSDNQPPPRKYYLEPLLYYFLT